MSSKCYWGFLKDGIHKVTLNLHGGELEDFGKTLVEFCRKHSLDDLKWIYDEITLVDYAMPAPVELVEKYAHDFGRTMDIGIPTCSGEMSDWKCLLSLSQGNPEAYAGKLQHMLDYSQDMKVNLHECNYAFILDLDKGRFRVYEWDYGRYDELLDFDIQNIPGDWIVESNEVQ